VFSLGNRSSALRYRFPGLAPLFGITGAGPCFAHDRSATASLPCLPPPPSLASLTHYTRLAAAQTALANKRLLIMGNSVSRHWLFAMKEALASNDTKKLNSASSYRQMEKGLCDNTPGFRCDAHVPELGTYVAFEWSWNLYSELIDKALSDDFDVYVLTLGRTTSSCRTRTGGRGK
jgi:hypothetical protein